MDATPAIRLHLDAVIAPAPSLSLKGFAILFGALVTLNLVMATVFWLLGALPVPVFLGMDVVAVGAAFLVSYRRTRLRERVQVCADHVRVMREDGRRSDTVWTSPTAFTRVQLADTGRYGVEARLMLSGRQLVIGQMLGPKARADLVAQVQDAIRSARAERHPV